MFDIEGAKIRIQKRRLELGYSRRYVADQMGVSSNSVVKWDDLKTFPGNFPTIDHLVELCEVLETTPNYILLGKE